MSYGDEATAPPDTEETFETGISFVCAEFSVDQGHFDLTRKLHFDAPR
jgi:hypothetical protein